MAVVTLGKPLLLFPEAHAQNRMDLARPPRVVVPPGRLELGREFRAVVAFHPDRSFAVLRIRDRQGLTELPRCQCLAMPGPATLLDVSAHAERIITTTTAAWPAPTAPPECCLVATADGFEIRIGPRDQCPGVGCDGHHTLLTNLPSELFGPYRDFGMAIRGLASHALGPSDPASPTLRVQVFPVGTEED